MKKLLITGVLMLLFIGNRLYAQESLFTTNYSTYYGATGTDDADVVTIDLFGNTYLGCHSNSINLPGAKRYPYSISGEMDAFVIKLNKEGSEIVYLTKLGGSKWDAIQGLISDAEGNIYAVGTTYSSDFPIDSNGFQSRFGGKSDAFVIKLNPEGKVLWSTFLGGSKDEDGRGIIIDKYDNIHIVGRTKSKNFPVSDNALQLKSAGGIDAFVTTLDTNGKMMSSTYLGGSGDDIGFVIKSDNNSQLYVSGTTNSLDFPIKNAIQKGNNGKNDAFLTVIDKSRSIINFSSYLGGEEDDQLYSIDLNPLGDIFIMGVTNSLNYPTTKGAFQTNFGGVRDVFVTKLNLQKNEITYSTYLGGEKGDNPRNLVVNENGNAFIVGYTASKNFPTMNSQNIKLSGSDDAFITMLDPSGSSLNYSTFFGGEDRDFFEGLVLGTDGSLTVSGGSSSIDFPLMNPLQTTFKGGRFDMIVARFTIPKHK